MPRDRTTLTPREWFSAAELAALALPGMPGTKRGVQDMAERQYWQAPDREGTHWRTRQGRGGGVEFHLACLPMAAKAHLAFAEHQAATPVAPPPAAEGQWEWFARQPDSKKRKARERLVALDAVETLVRAGTPRVRAMEQVARQNQVNRSALYEWAKVVRGLDRADWLPALAPRHGGGREAADCSPEAWTWIKSEYLTQSQPDFTMCYRLLAQQAAASGWTIPAERTLHRRMMALPLAQRVLTRQGVEALKRTFPAQRRDRGIFHALEAVNADGHVWDVFVRWPDGTVGRPHMVAFQDLYSGKILSWRVDVALSWHAVRLAFGDVVERYGIPRLCWLDNGREFASKHITGGQATRFRFKVKEEEPEGLMTSLGVEVHWTTPYHGQSKPIERAFRDFASAIAKRSAFVGAYTGNSPTSKPENHGSRAVPLEEFLRVVSEGIIEHNARPGRRSPTCAGRSFDETFAASYQASVIPQAAPARRHLWLLAAEALRVRKPDACIHFHGNRYWHERLHAYMGQQVTARFDPEALGEPLHVFGADGRYIGEAPCVEAVGFADVGAAKAHARKIKAYLRATRTADELRDRLTLDELVRAQPKEEAPEPPEARLVRPLFAGNAALKIAADTTTARAAAADAAQRQDTVIDALRFFAPPPVPDDEDDD